MEDSARSRMRVGVFFRLHGRLLDGVRGVDQAAQQRLFFDDAGVVLQVRDARHAVHQLREISRSARGLEFSLAVQLVGRASPGRWPAGSRPARSSAENAPVLI